MFESVDVGVRDRAFVDKAVAVRVVDRLEQSGTRERPARCCLEVLNGNLLERQGERRYVALRPPIKLDGDAEIRKRPRQTDADAEVDMDVEGIEDICGEARIKAERETEAEDFKPGLPVQPQVAV
jgi:hypothetical protein